MKNINVDEFCIDDVLKNAKEFKKKDKDKDKKKNLMMSIMISSKKMNQWLLPLISNLFNRISV